MDIDIYGKKYKIYGSIDFFLCSSQFAFMRFCRGDYSVLIGKQTDARIKTAGPTFFLTFMELLKFVFLTVRNIYYYHDYQGQGSREA